MGDGGQGMVALLGVPPDRRLLAEDLPNLPDTEQFREPPVATSRQHNRLVAAGSVLTGTTLIGGVALALFGAWQLLFQSGGVFAAVLTLVGILLAGTHWGWVHVAEYVGVTIDDRHDRALDERRRDWLASIQPYPRFSVTTSVLDDASTRVERVLHRPVLTPQNTFTFVRETDAEETYDAHESAATIAEGVEKMRRQARLETDRLSELWEAASTTYDAAMLSAHDDQERLAAQRAAATALSEHINASLLEPPLVE
ncbi:MAG TPA: hypothetical protein VGI67_14740 [Thermoleophilaceae bacterium]|jgi:hypothetical protein